MSGRYFEFITMQGRRVSRAYRYSLRSACSRGPLRPLRGSAFGLGQPDDFVAGASPHGSRTPAMGKSHQFAGSLHKSIGTPRVKIFSFSHLRWRGQYDTMHPDKWPLSKRPLSKCQLSCSEPRRLTYGVLWKRRRNRRTTTVA